MSPSIEKYRPLIVGLGLSHGGETEMLKVLWAIAVSFRDRAFGIDAVQLSCGSDVGTSFALIASEVESRWENFSNQFNETAAIEAAEKTTT